MFPRFIRERAGVGQYVALVIKVEHVEERSASNGQPYLVLHGIDIDHSRIESLLIFHHGVSDIGSVSDGIFIAWIKWWGKDRRKVWVRKRCVLEHLERLRRQEFQG